MYRHDDDNQYLSRIMVVGCLHEILRYPVSLDACPVTYVASE